MTSTLHELPKFNMTHCDLAEKVPKKKYEKEKYWFWDRWKIKEDKKCPADWQSTLYCKGALATGIWLQSMRTLNGAMKVELSAWYNQERVGTYSV